MSILSVTDSRIAEQLYWEQQMQARALNHASLEKKEKKEKSPYIPLIL